MLLWIIVLQDDHQICANQLLKAEEAELFYSIYSPWILHFILRDLNSDLETSILKIKFTFCTWWYPYSCYRLFSFLINRLNLTLSQSQYPEIYLDNKSEGKLRSGRSSHSSINLLEAKWYDKRYGPTVSFSFWQIV